MVVSYPSGGNGAQAEAGLAGDPCGRAEGMIHNDRDCTKAADVIEMEINRAVTYALPRLIRMKFIARITY